MNIMESNKGKESGFAREIDEFHLRSAVVQTMERMEKIAKSTDINVRKLMPSIVLFCDEGCGASEIINIYDKMLVENDFYKYSLSDTVLELSFPESSDERVLKKFFASPLVVANNNFQKAFSGVFVINFHGWKGRKLNESDEFKKLLSFIKDNENIFYVFRFTSDMDYKQEIINNLSECVNLVQICIDKPDINDSIRYIEEKLAASGYIAELNEIADLIKMKIDVNSPGYAGYKTLSQLCDRIICELILEEKGVHDNHSGQRRVELSEISDRIVVPSNAGVKNLKFGFGR